MNMVTVRTSEIIPHKSNVVRICTKAVVRYPPPKETLIAPIAVP
jgi:hypothetical protein